MLKILQVRLQKYVTQELPDIQAGFRKGRGTRGQTANIHWIIEKAREFQKNIYFCFIDYTKAFDCVKWSEVKSLSRVQLFATPWSLAYWTPPSMGFSRQEYWGGLPFPSPMHESEKWKWSRSVVSNSLQPHGLQPTRLLHPWDSPGKSTGVGCHCLLQGRPHMPPNDQAHEPQLLSSGAGEQQLPRPIPRAFAQQQEEPPQEEAMHRNLRVAPTHHN